MELENEVDSIYKARYGNHQEQAPERGTNNLVSYFSQYMGEGQAKCANPQTLNDKLCIGANGSEIPQSFIPMNFIFVLWRERTIQLDNQMTWVASERGNTTVAYVIFPA